MAWMRMMGADSVAYHRETIIERGDDFPGAALEYYASRGETPLLWGGSGAQSLGLVGPVDNPSYDALYGPGGACDPKTGERLVNARRPGMELVIAAHKSRSRTRGARSGGGHARHHGRRTGRHARLPGRTDQRAGRTAGRGRASRRRPPGWSTPTPAMPPPGPATPALTTTCCIANVDRDVDEQGREQGPGHDPLAGAPPRRHHGRPGGLGRQAVELGYGIEADPGPSGKLGHWRIAGIPDEALAVHSKRAAEINEAVAEKGFATYQARQVAARETQKSKRHTPVEELVPRWRAELTHAGFAPERLVADIERAGHAYQRQHSGVNIIGNRSLATLATDVLGPRGILSDRKVFSKRDVIVAVAPSVFGLPARELEKATERVLRDPDAIPLVGVPRASEQAFSTAHVISTELAIEQAVERGVENLGAARVTPEVASDAVARQGAVLGSPLTPGQQAAVMGIATSGRGVELVEGVAGSGKTTVMAAVRDAFESAGFTVVGTSTSGQAARTLGREAGLTDSRTLASLRWRLEHEQMRLTEGHVLVLDEAGMASDRDIAFLLEQARHARSKVVMVGDDRQLGAVSVGGSMGALVERHGGIVHALDQNVRQHNESERAALVELRAGDVTRAVEFYLANQRVVTERTRDEALNTLVDQWARDTLAGKDAAMFAWRRANVAELNRLARVQMTAEGRLSGPELVAPGGTAYAAGDRIVTLAPAAEGQVVTSERGVVTAVDLEAQRLAIETEDGKRYWFAQEAIGQSKLAHGYATTVHRSQGATHDIAHVYEDGGGRELAYVAVSRARRRPTSTWLPTTSTRPERTSVAAGRPNDAGGGPSIPVRSKPTRRERHPQRSHH